MIDVTLQDIKDDVADILLHDLFRGKDFSELNASDFFAYFEDFNLETGEVVKTSRGYIFKMENMKQIIKDIFPECWQRAQQQAQHFGLEPKQYLKDVYFDGFKLMFENLEKIKYPQRFEFVPDFNQEVPF